MRPSAPAEGTPASPYAAAIRQTSNDLWAVTGSRGFCWRYECRLANGPYLTVSYLCGNVVVAHCHGGEYRSLFDLVVELMAHTG